MESIFGLGQRVKAARQITGVRRGACGTIALVYEGVPNVYDVAFDKYGLVRLLSGESLSPLRTRAEIAKCASEAQTERERTV